MLGQWNLAADISEMAGKFFVAFLSLRILSTVYRRILHRKAVLFLGRSADDAASAESLRYHIPCNCNYYLYWP